MLYSRLILLLAAPLALAKRKCTPGDDCLPSASKWKILNSTVQGHLKADEPLAKPCYTGDLERCQEINAKYLDSFTLEDSPIGYQYSAIDTCAPLNYLKPLAGQPMCDPGTAPVYSINVTNPNHVAAGIEFAKENNVRLVIKNTGQDVRGRSHEYGSLSIWMRKCGPNSDSRKTILHLTNPVSLTWRVMQSLGSEGWDEVKGAALYGPLCQNELFRDL